MTPDTPKNAVPLPQTCGIGFDPADVIRREFLARGAHTACATCPDRETCEFAFDEYNTDVEPGIDCLAAK